MSSVSWQISRFHNAIKDWFRYNGRTFEANMYDRFQRAHAEWEREASTVEINHQFESYERSSQDCKKCGEVPDKLACRSRDVSFDFLFYFATIGR